MVPELWGSAKRQEGPGLSGRKCCLLHSSGTSAEPVRLSATSNLHVPSSMPGKEKERDRRMGKGPKKWIEKKVGKAGTSDTVSHCLTLVSCPSFDARNDQRKREGEGKKKKKGVSNSSDRGTPQRTLSTHGNTCFFSTKYKTQEQCRYNTSLFYKATSPNMGITTVTTTHRVIYASL